MSELLANGKVTLHCGDCLDLLATMPENSIDSVVCDPPYHLTDMTKRYGKEDAKPCGAGTDGSFRRLSRGFMGKAWDGGDVAFQSDTWRAVLHVLKPGGHLVAFSSTRTYHRMATAIEDAGFNIRDFIVELIACNNAVGKFVASLNDAQIGAFFKCLDESQFGGILAWVYGSGFPKSHNVSKGIDKHLGAIRERKGAQTRTEASNAISRTGFGADGWASQVDEPISDLARAWDGWGTALKPALEPICLARKPLIGTVVETVLAHGTGGLNIDGCRVGDEERFNAATGRWPANVITDGSADACEGFPDTTSGTWDGTRPGDKTNSIFGKFGTINEQPREGSSGSASRFFYSAKADQDDRLGSKHPTVKPVDLMQWLVRLITPKGGTVLDCFAGTGTTGEAAFREGMHAVLIEREPEYQADIRRRMSLVLGGLDERKRESIKASGKTADAGPLFGFMETVGGGNGRQIYGEFADENGKRRGAR